MATTSNRISTIRDDKSLTSDLTAPRARNEQTAQRLTLVAMRQWEKALTGVVAIPAAAALSAAAGAMFVATLCERTFEMIEGAIADMGKRVGDEFDAHGDPRDAIAWRRNDVEPEARS